MRLPFLRPKPQLDAEPVRPAAQRAERGRGPVPPEGGGPEVTLARTRARQRLVGALVLLVIGIVGFPVLFETTPRPLPMDIPIEVPTRAGQRVEPTPVPGRPLPVRSLPVDAGAEAAVASGMLASAPIDPAPEPAAAVVVAAPSPAPVAVPAAPPAPASRAAPQAQRTPASAPRAPATATAGSAPRVAAAAPLTPDGARAAALLAGTTPASAVPAAPAPAGRFVVQAGAYTDAATLREARAKVEKLGLKTYTQVIENDAGKRTRVRLGPYATRQEADAAADRLRRAGLPANVLAL